MWRLGWATRRDEENRRGGCGGREKRMVGGGGREASAIATHREQNNDELVQVLGELLAFVVHEEQELCCAQGCVAAN